MAEEIQEVLLQQKPVSAAAKPLGSVSPLSRRVFSAQDGARQKLKTYVQNRLEINFLNLFLKICTLSVARTASENVRVVNFGE
jgi:hypothetical protein